MAGQEEERYPKNVSGPFFVVNGECLSCRAPEHEAPDLMGYDEAANHCYFKRQPASAAEWDRALKAVNVACCEAVRYGGDDEAVRRRMVQLAVEMIEEAQRKPWWAFWR